MPANFLYLDLITLWYPDALIVHTRRDPRAVRWSCFTSHLTWPYCELEACRAYQQEYESLMNYWVERIPMNSLELDYADSVASPEATKQKIADFFRQSDVPVSPERAGRYATRTPNKFTVSGEVHTRSLERWTHYKSMARGLLS